VNVCAGRDHFLNANTLCCRLGKDRKDQANIRDVPEALSEFHSVGLRRIDPRICA
jgi:hypothetical protein